MRTRGFRSLSLALGALLALGAAPARALPSPGKLPKVVLKEVVDNRKGGGTEQSGLFIVLRLEGENLDAFPAGRALLKDARDDSGRSLLPEKVVTPPLWDLNMSPLQLDLVAPSGSARSVSVSGTVAGPFAPGKDPNAVVKVPKALLELDKPLVSPGLAAAKIQVTPLSKARYAEEQKRQTGKEATSRIRQQMKAEGRSDKEITATLERREAFIKTFGSGKSGPAVILFAKLEDFQKIHSVTILGADGKELPGGAMLGAHDGVMATRRYNLKDAPGPETTIVFTILTEKARVTIPFDLKNLPLR